VGQPENAASGVELLGQSWWKVGEPDFTPYITAILSAKPDAVIIATGGRDCVPFLKAAKATGFNERAFRSSCIRPPSCPP
jgi:ABC-type branched-subunit amino acid transport system substrate-binding protein